MIFEQTQKKSIGIGDDGFLIVWEAKEISKTKTKTKKDDPQSYSRDLYPSFLCNPKAVFTQIYDDYIGAGHNTGITISTSHNNTESSGDHTVDGFGFMPDQYAASRFLAQSTLDADYETIQQLSQSGYSDWLDEQMALPLSLYYNKTDDIYQQGLLWFG